MATYSDLKQRIVSEMTRDDLEDDLSALLETHIARAIEYYQGDQFWFNYGSATVSASAAEVAMPATMRVIDSVRTPDGNLLTKVGLEEILASTATSGTPTHYAEFGDGIYVYPTPSSAVTLTLYGTKYITPPSTGTDSNAWTNAAQDLISSHTQTTLYREKFRDDNGVARARAATSDAYIRLKAETSRRNETPLRMPGHFPTGGYYAYS